MPRVFGLRLAMTDSSSDESLDAEVRAVLDDENRYVRGDALFALQRIDTAEAKDTLIKHLMPARWCPLTTRESTF